MHMSRAWMLFAVSLLNAVDLSAESAWCILRSYYRIAELAVPLPEISAGRHALFRTIKLQQSMSVQWCMLPASSWELSSRSIAL
jgi:hypothetical protein